MAPGASCQSPFPTRRSRWRCPQSAVVSRRSRSLIRPAINTAGSLRPPEMLPPSETEPCNKIGAPVSDRAVPAKRSKPHRTGRIASLLAIIAASTLMSTAAESPVRFPASSLARSAAGEKSPDASGFLQRWLILDPIRSNAGLTDDAVKEAARKEYFPNQLTVIPRDGDKVTIGGEELAWHAVDTSEYNVNLYHFAHDRNKPTSFVLFWAVTIVNCMEEMRDVRLAVGSNAASVWWVNGREVIGIYGDRQTVIDDGVSKRLTLKKGSNVVRCAVLNGGGATDFCARFLDAGDLPVHGITTTLGQTLK